MGTRSTILVTGHGNYSPMTIRLYKHWDGYPTGNLSIIERALESAISLKSRDAARFGNDEKPLTVELVVGKIIGEATDVTGMGAKIEETFQDSLKPEHFGNQGDLEWVYVIDCDAKTVKMYGGDYQGKGKTKDPLSYIECLKDEYKTREKHETEKLIRLVEAWGFKVNPKAARLKAVV